MFPISFSFGRQLSQNVDEQDRNIARTRIAELPRLFRAVIQKCHIVKNIYLLYVKSNVQIKCGL